MVWAVLYLTVFLGSKHKAVQGILFAVAAIAVSGWDRDSAGGWSSWEEQTFCRLARGCGAGSMIAVLPLCFSLFRLRKSSVPVTAAIAFSIALPWCQRIWTESYNYGDYHQTSTAQ